MNKAKIKLKSFGITLLLISMFMQNWLIEVFAPFTYLDEIVTLFCIAFYLLRKKHDKSSITLLAISIVLLGWGLFCNINFSIQNNVSAITEDIFSCFKFVWVYIGLKEFLRYRGVNSSNVLRYILPIFKTYLIVLSVFAAINLLADIGMSSEIRYGLRSFAFVYGTPGHLINQMTYGLILLNAEKEYYARKNTLFQVFCLLVMICTLKSRALVLVTLYIVLEYFFILRKKKRLGLEIILICLVVALMGGSSFEYYFFTERAPRQMFLLGAIKLVREYFPFGTGFATYGSSGAAKTYSQLYYYLGFNNRWGMAPDTPLFLNDNYLPMIFVQFGLIFAIVFLYLIYKYCITTVRDEKALHSQGTRMITMFIVLNMVLSSVQSSYLAAYPVVTLITFFMIFFYPNKRGIKNDGN